MNRLRAAATALALLALPALPAPLVSAANAQDSATVRRNLLIRVQSRIGEQPLAHSIVSLPALGISRFTSANGAIVIPVPAAGPQRLIVKRLGFTPADTVIIVGDAPSQLLTIRLARVSFRLEAVRVIAWPPCRQPGLRRATAEVRGIVGQLRENAERYRLLTQTYPFNYLMERELGQRVSDGSYIAQARDSIWVSGTPLWTYRPGTLIARERGTVEWMMRIPSIGDLAEDAFVDNHCFHVSGLEQKEDRQLLRIDIIAAQRLRGVDVNVVAWLDPQGYQLRHATFTLTRPPEQVAGILHVSTSAEYRELIPFVPILERLLAENTVQQGRTRSETRVLLERQRTTRVTYTGPRPDSLFTDSTARPPLP